MLENKVVTIIQARSTSSRLPGKVLLELAGQPMLARVVARAQRAARVSQTIVATTTDPSDEPVAALCQDLGVACFRGSLYDVLDRFYQAALATQAGVVVRVTADCPIVDPGEMDRVIDAFFAAGADFAANRLPPPWKRTTPTGLDTEVCSFDALERAWREAAEQFEREHVMPYLYDTPGRFKVHVADLDEDYGDLRWTVDTPEDLAVIRQVYAAFGGRDDFSWRDVLALQARRPDLFAANQRVQPHSLTAIDRRYTGEGG